MSSNQPIYTEKPINCRKCNALLCKIVIKPEKIEIGLQCEKEHRHIIEIDKRTWEIRTLIEKEEET